MFAVFAAFGSIVWVAYVDSTAGPAVGEPPLIQAAAEPLKLAPDDPGGRDVPDQGEVRGLLSGEPMPQTERVLPPPEQPRTPDEDAALALLGDDAPAVPEAEAAAGDAADEREDAAESAVPGDDRATVAEPQPEAGATAPETDSVAPEAAPEAAEVEPAAGDEEQVAAPQPSADGITEDAEDALESLLDEVTGGSGVEAPSGSAQSGDGTASEEAAPSDGAAEDTPTETAAATPQANGSAEPQVERAPPESEVEADGERYRIQLAAVRNEADARRAWDLFRLDLGEVLEGLDPIIERADTANGVFYRVQVGPFAEMPAAEGLCDELKQRNASCFVVRR